MNLSLPIDLDKLVTAGLLALAGLCVKWVRDQHKLRAEVRELHRQVRASYDVSRRVLHMFTHGSVDIDELARIRYKVDVLRDTLWAEEGHVPRRPVKRDVIDQLLGGS